MVITNIPTKPPSISYKGYLLGVILVYLNPNRKFISPQQAITNWNKAVQSVNLMLDAEKPRIEYKVQRKSSTREWIVRKYINGKLDADSDYFTDNKQDAENTRDYCQKREDEKSTQSFSNSQDSRVSSFISYSDY